MKNRQTEVDRSRVLGGGADNTRVGKALLTNGFVNWDDPFTLQNNARLAAPGVLRWAFTTTEMGHYQPLAWLVWSEIKALFGLNPVAFHALSLIGHLLNGALVYFVCIRLALAAGLEARPRQFAALVAALAFAVHPIRVEVVAWASAFPYVLSLGLTLVALLAYLSYCANASAAARRWWLGLSVCIYALSLLSRVNAIGFPLVLLALDVYPLRRVASQVRPRVSRNVTPAPTLRTWGRLLVEKIPFLVVALVAAVAESRARELPTLEEVGLGARLTMAATAPFAYLGRTLLPIRLSPVDPLPMQPHLEWLPLTLGAAGLVAITVAAWKARGQWPALPVAWVVYVLLLAPAIGLTPSGLQATADRYMYLPGVVLSLLVGVAVARVNPIARRRWALLPLASLLALLAAATWRQTGWWHDSITLWTRAADLDPRNDIATYNLAIALAEAGRVEDAAGRYEQTLQLVPDHELARHNLDRIRAGQAEQEGDRLAETGRLDEAIDRYSRALALDSARLHARSARGIALVRRGRFKEAVADLRPVFGGRADDRAVASALAFALVQTQQAGEAATVLKHALARYPDDVELAHNLARLLATTSDPDVRDGALALRLALAIRDRTSGRDARVLDTLAAAYAAAGQRALAIRTAKEAAALASQLGEADLAEEITSHGRSYER